MASVRAGDGEYSGRDNEQLTRLQFHRRTVSSPTLYSDVHSPLPVPDVENPTAYQYRYWYSQGHTASYLFNVLQANMTTASQDEDGYFHCIATAKTCNLAFTIHVGLRRNGN
jgi:hypothetical protein